MKSVKNNKKSSLNTSITKILLKSAFLFSLFFVDKAQADNCTRVGERGTSGACQGKLIVNRQDLLDAIEREDYRVQGPDANGNDIYYTFEDDANNIYTGNITNFSKLFQNKANFNADIGYWNVDNATNMSFMFNNASSFNQNINGWNVESVTNMRGMFHGASSFNKPLNNWNPIEVVNMHSMFRGAKVFNRNINDWGNNTGKVTNMGSMFRGALVFNQPLGSWDVSQVTTMQDMFRDAKAFNGRVLPWTTSSVTNFKRVFYKASSFNKDIGDWDVSKAVSMNGLLGHANAFAGDISNWNVSGIEKRPKNFATTNQANYKEPCWGLDGCAADNTIPVLQSNWSPNGYNNSLSGDEAIPLILEFDKAVRAGDIKKANLQLFHQVTENGKQRYKRVRAYSLKNPNLVQFEEVNGVQKRIKVLNIRNELSANTKYYVKVNPKAILSRNNNVPFAGINAGFGESGGVYFSTGADSILEIKSTSPTYNSQTDLLATEDPSITIQFSESVALANSGNITIRKNADDSDLRVYSLNDASDKEDIKVEGEELTLFLKDSNGNSLVNSSTTYYLVIDANTIQNATSTKSLTAITKADGYTFQTVAAEKCGAIRGRAKYWRGKGAASTTVKIYRGDVEVATKTTNDLGDYSYFPTVTGTYKVEFVKPSSESNLPRFARAAVISSESIKNSGRWVRNIEITSACEFHEEIDGLLIDPKGIIYDSNTRQPIAGATVKFLYNGELVNNDWLDDSGGENTQITESDGEYSFILKADTAADGIYTIQVSPPTAYKFKSSQITSESETYTPQLGAQIDEIQSQETAPDSNQETTYYLSFSFVFGENASSTSNGVINNHIPIDPAADPTAKADVKGLVEAWTDAAIRFNKSSVKAVNKRFDWLRSNQNSEKKSHQGINISFANPLLKKAFNGSTKRFKDLDNRDLESWARSNWSNERLKNKSDQVFNDLIDNSVNLAFAELRDKTFKPNLNRTGGEIIGNWSLWSNGEILIDNSDSSSNSSGKDTNSLYLTLGIDKPYKDNNLFGMAFTYGKDDISVGNLGSGINSTNLGFNFYSSNLLKNKFPLETQIGFGKMDMNTKRIDNSTSHKGNRDVYMIFGSAKILAEPLKINNFQLTPYGRLDLAHINFKAFSESGSSLALTFKDQTVNRKMVSLGLNLDRDFIFENWRLKPFLGISYGYDFTGDSIVDMNYVGDSQNYRIILDKLSSEQWTTSLGFEFYRNNNWSGSMSYDYQNSDSYSYSNSYQFNLNWYF